MKNSTMTFDDALKKLGIEDYKNQILASNSHGELFHCYDYCMFATSLTEECIADFRFWFEACVRFAKLKWQRWESCFQHMPQLISDMISLAEKSVNEKCQSA